MDTHDENLYLSLFNIKIIWKYNHNIAVSLRILCVFLT